MISCQVYLLDESEIDIHVKQNASGAELFNSVCEYLNIVEKDYFGLIYKGTEYQNIWVKLEKSLKKQFASQTGEWKFNFAVKFYPTDPAYLREEITKYQLCLQIRDDLMNGRLPCPFDTLAVLSSYWLQSEFGDNEEQSAQVKKYLTSLKYMASIEGQPAEFEDKILKLYNLRRGMPPSDADTQFLRLACTLPLYGVHRYIAETKDKIEIALGIGSAGIMEVVDSDKPTLFKWPHIKNINYKKEKFYVKLLPNKEEKHFAKKVYFLKSALQAHSLWQDAVGQHVFFRVTGSDTTSSGPTPKNSPAPAAKSSLAKKRKRSFRLSFRKKKPKTETQVREESSKIKRPNPPVVRQSGQRMSISVTTDIAGKYDSSSDESSEDGEEILKPSKPLHSILKHKSSIKKKDIDTAEDNILSEDCTVGEDVLTEDENNLNSNLPQSLPSLLLTETIPEEDEAEYAATPEEQINSARDPEHKNEMPNDEEVDQDPERLDSLDGIAEDVTKPKVAMQSLSLPIVKVEVCSSENDFNVEEEKNVPVKPTKLSPPPLVTQTTREAIKIYVKEETEKVEKPTSKCNELENTIEKSSPEVKNETINNSDECVSENHDDTSPGSEESNDGEDKMIEAISAVAVLGDDDVTVGDLTEFDGNFKKRSESSDSHESSKISSSSVSSISDITDNTEELCNPNILEIIWAKCSAVKDYDYREIFGVKLRRVKGRSRNVKSIYDDDNLHSVSTQVPTPPPCDENKDSESPAKGLSTNNDKRRFIPSWPFDPDSVALNTELDELDREAIKAALYAQRDIADKADDPSINTLMLDEVEASLIIPSSSAQPESEDIFEEKEFADEEFSNDSCTTPPDSIPGIPIFVKSLQIESESESNLSSKKSRGNSTTSESPVTPKVETLVYPPSVLTFQEHLQNELGLLEYKPEVCSFSKGKPEPNPPFPTSLQSYWNRQEGGTSKANEISEVKEKTFSVDKESSTKSTAGSTHSFNESQSGRSTPMSATSASSFPRFIQSVFPLRNSSLSSNSETDIHESDNKVLATPLETKSERTLSTSVESLASSKNVQSKDEEECELGQSVFSEPESNPTDTPSHITILAFINENCDPDVIDNYDEEQQDKEEPKSLVFPRVYSSASCNVDHEENGKEDSQVSTPSTQEEITANATTCDELSVEHNEEKCENNISPISSNATNTQQCENDTDTFTANTSHDPSPTEALAVENNAQSVLEGCEEETSQLESNTSSIPDHVADDRPTVSGKRYPWESVDKSAISSSDENEHCENVVENKLVICKEAKSQCPDADVTSKREDTTNDNIQDDTIATGLETQQSDDNNQDTNSNEGADANELD